MSSWLDDYKTPVPAGEYDPTNAMGSMSWGDLLAMRRQAGQDMAAQVRIAPYEHQAFAREQDSPYKSALVGGLLEPGYQAVKLIPGSQSVLDYLSGGGDGLPQTPASVAELIGGVKGGWQGLTGDSLPGLLKTPGKAK